MEEVQHSMVDSSQERSCITACGGGCAMGIEMVIRMHSAQEWRKHSRAWCYQNRTCDTTMAPWSVVWSGIEVSGHAEKEAMQYRMVLSGQNLHRSTWWWSCSEVDGCAVRDRGSAVQHGHFRTEPALQSPVVVMKWSGRLHWSGGFAVRHGAFKTCSAVCGGTSSAKSALVKGGACMRLCMHIQQLHLWRPCFMCHALCMCIKKLH
eukprot:scaffold181651_cov26-Tisochrysis_lutea.AAC.1